jgi:hypothetical protein
MSVSSPVLDDVVQGVRTGAHLVLRGHLRDELVVEGRIVTARWGLGRALLDRAGLDAIVFVDADGGVSCAGHEGRAAVKKALAGIRAADQDSLGTPIPRGLGVKTPVEIANTVLALMRQGEIGVAVVLDDLDVIVNPSDETGRRTIALLRRAMAEAECIPGRGPQAPRNTIVALDSPPCPLGAVLAGIPGVQVIEVAPPARETRAAALAGMARRFYGSDTRTGSWRAGLDLITDRRAGCSVRDLEQLRRLSHELRISPSRPAALLAARLGSSLNPVAERGVDAIMEELEASVVGQRFALTRMRELLEDARYPNAARGRGTTPTTPLMVAFAFGPPGIGKTETARALGRALFGSEAGIVRIDCGEYQSGHDVARLTGAPPGYVGHDGGGQLTEPLRRGPAVVIFDEFEKPQHDALVDLLLAILDEGRLTDGRGDVVTFERAIVMFTTNLGSAELEASRRAKTEEFLSRSEQLVRDRISLPEEQGGMGRPELLSRLEGALVPFDFLRLEALPAIVAKYCSNIAANLSDEMNVSLQIDGEQFAEAFRPHLDGDKWDGRTVERLARRRVEGPLREHLKRFEGDSGRVVPDADGSATIIGAVSERTAT